jgi:hypothetical protein
VVKTGRGVIWVEKHWTRNSIIEISSPAENENIVLRNFPTSFFQIETKITFFGNSLVQFAILTLT